MCETAVPSIGLNELNYSNYYFKSLFVIINVTDTLSDVWSQHFRHCRVTYEQFSQIFDQIQVCHVFESTDSSGNYNATLLKRQDKIYRERKLPFGSPSSKQGMVIHGDLSNNKIVFGVFYFQKMTLIMEIHAFMLWYIVIINDFRKHKWVNIAQKLSRHLWTLWNDKKVSHSSFLYIQHIWY